MGYFPFRAALKYVSVSPTPRRNSVVNANALPATKQVVAKVVNRS